MFGYVKVFRDDLKCRDYDLFRAYYCGLCRALGKYCTQSSRFGLNYDMTFLAIVLSAVSDETVGFVAKPCIAHPLRKKVSVKTSKELEYVANMSVILGYLKLSDDFFDDKSIKALFGKLLYLRAFYKAKKKYKDEYLKIKEWIKRLSLLEKENCGSIDETADCFAKILEILFTPSFIKEQRRELAWMGYNIGRWIYIIDAFADMERDFKKKAYNPFLVDVLSEDELVAKKAELVKNLDETLTFTLHNATSAYELLKLHKNQEIIKNILYIGLGFEQTKILFNRKENNNESL